MGRMAIRQADYPSAAGSPAKAFRIFPEQVRIGGQQMRGYQVSQFEDAFATYLQSPSSPGI
jgi:hypothetical protein